MIELLEMNPLATQFISSKLKDDIDIARVAVINKESAVVFLS